MLTLCPFELILARVFAHFMLTSGTLLPRFALSAPLFAFAGVIICTAHACHADMGKMFLDAGKHVLMEKPMTVDVPEARDLAAAADAALRDQKLCFMVNNTANYRDKCFDARRLVEEGQLGDIHHVLCVMYSPLMFLFDDPANDGWVKATGSMLQSDGSGNGFGYGQLSHLLGWVLHVAGLDVEEVTAMTHRSEKSGADLTDAALIRCKGDISVSLSGGCSWPGNEHGDEATGTLRKTKRRPPSPPSFSRFGVQFSNGSRDHLTRQARDKHMENSKTRWVFRMQVGRAGRI
jgi:predicted dehydrogenase